MTTVGTLLARAARQVGTPAGLEAVIAAWRETPAVTLVELAERWEQAHPGPSFEGDTDDFRARARAATAAERGGLLKALIGPKSADTLARLEAIARWEPDPRTSRALEQLLRDVPYTSDGTRPVWTAAFRVVAALGDPRFVPMRHALVAGWKFRENHRAWMTAALERATQGLADEVPELADADEAAARALAARLKVAPKPARDQDEAGLLADVYANPHDDGPRQVYADWLLERGDPRGELIALQFASKPNPKREAALLKAHGRAWLGALEPVVTKDVVFRRGFPAVVTARFKHQKDAEAHGSSPAWSTIEEIAWSEGTPGVNQQRWTLFVPPTLRARKITTHGAGVVQLLDAPRPWDVEDLTALARDVDVQARFAETSLFPKVTRLTVSELATPAQFVGGWMGRVKDVTIDDVHGPLGPWLEGLGATAIERLTLARDWAGALVIQRGADGQLTQAVLVPDRAPNVGRVAELLELLPDGGLTRLDLGPLAKAAPLAPIAAAKVRARGKAAPRPKKSTINPSCAQVFAIGWAGDQIRVVARERLLVLDAAPIAESPINEASAAAFSPDGQTVAVGTHKSVELRDASTGRRLGSFAVTHTPKGLQFHTAGKQLFVVSDAAMAVHDLPSGKVVRTVAFGSYPRRPISAACSSDCGTLAAALYSEQVVVYPPGAKRAARTYVHGNFTDQVLFLAPDRLVTSCRDENLRIFDLAQAEPVKVRKVVESPVLLLSPDGTRLLAAGGNRTRLLDPVTLDELGVLKPVLGCPAFSADGKRVAGWVKKRIVVCDVR